MQTIDRPTPRRKRPVLSGAAIAAGVALTLPILLLAIFTKIGVLVVVILAVLAGMAIWVRRKEFAFIEMVAFLIHFDGIGFGPITTGRIVAGSAVALMVVKLLSGWRPPAIPARYWIPVWALTVWGVFSGAYSDSAGTWVFALGVYGLGIAFFCVTSLMVDSHQAVQQFLRAFWVGGLFGSAAGILALFLGTRSVGFGGDPNFFGLLQAAMIPLTVYYRRHAVDARMKLFYSLTLVVVLAGAAGAGSRSGLIGGAIAIVATMVTRPGLQPIRRVGVSVGAVFLAGIAFMIGFVANPANLQRGFSDRGAGRLDLWNVSIELIKLRPMVGYGFGQIKALIVPNLLTTPGSKRLGESRTEVSAHNTWLDVTGDLGAIGLLLFVTIFVVAIYGFLRPRWPQAKELSTTLFVMMLPVLSGSFFLPLLNNKLAWALIGLSAALQVPSWGARWSGLAGEVDQPVLSSGSRAGPDRAPVPIPISVPAVPGATVTPPGANGDPSWDSVKLARWDLKVSRRFRAWILLGALIGAVVMGAVGTVLPTKYIATSGIVVPALDGPQSRPWLTVDRERMQGILTLAISGAYAAELKEQSGLDLSVPEIRDRMSVTRPKMGAYLELHYSDTDRDNTVQAMPYMISSLDAVFARSREFALDQLADEARQVVPGEQRYYTGDFYIRSSQDAVLADSPPRTAWLTFVGFLTGGMIAAGFALAQQRKPRVNNDDDFPAVLGLPVWSHVGRSGRRYGATRGQYAQVMAMAAEASPDDVAGPRRFVISSPRRDASARNLAVGIAAELVSEGRRVVLVDAQVDRPALSLRLGGFGRPGLAEAGAGEVPLAAVMRRVNPLRLPASARKLMSARIGEFRFVPAGRLRRSGTRAVPLHVLDELDPEVTVILMAPPGLGEVSSSSALGWGDAVVLALVEGRTVTFDAEEGAAMVRTFSGGANGVVLLDV